VGFKRPHTYLISIGIGSYRDVQGGARKYAASDAEVLTTYFQSLGGMPAANVRLLQDWKALKPDIDEALLDWLPGHMNKDAVVIVYFAGLATVAPNGDISLLPYDGNTTSASRSYPLKDLDAALSRLKAKQTLFFFDGTLTRLGSDNRSKTVVPQWNPSGSSTVHIVGMHGVGKAVEDEGHRLFGIGHPELLDGGARAHRVGDDRADVLDKIDVDPHADHRQHDVREHHGRVDVVAAHRLQRHLGAELRLVADLEERVRLPNLAVLRQRPARLAHEPDRRAINRLTLAGPDEPVVHAETRVLASAMRSSSQRGLKRIEAPSDFSSC